VKLLLALLLAMLPAFTMAQELDENLLDDDMTTDGDIFNDFNEDIEASQVLEDERFYRYARFFQTNIGLGMTTFTGNRGLAYEDNHPTFHLSVAFFLSFQVAITLGLEYSKHHMILDTATRAYPDQIVGLVETSMLRPFFGFRYYIDTTDLGTALTYSNPHFIGRAEYWYQTNKFIDASPAIAKQDGGGIGTGFGMGLEFPIELKKSYVSVEFLYHIVNFFDRFTMDYRQVPDDLDPDDKSKAGYKDLTGDALSMMVTYNFTW
jgi:hypothetical protein